MDRGTIAIARPVVAQASPSYSRRTPSLSRQKGHSGSRPISPRQQGTQRLIPARNAPRMPSIMAPQKMATLKCAPGSMKARGRPIQRQVSSKCSIVEKMAKKKAKMDSMGPMMRQPTRQKPKMYQYGWLGQMVKQIHRALRMVRRRMIDFLPRMGLLETFLNRFSLRMLIFFLLQMGRYIDTIPPSSIQLMSPPTFCFQRNRAAHSRISIILGVLLVKLEKKVTELRTMMPAAAALQPMRTRASSSVSSRGRPWMRRRQRSVMTEKSTHETALQMRKHLAPARRDFVLSMTMVMTTCTVVGPGRHQQSAFISWKAESESQLHSSTSFFWVKERWFCWSPAFWQPSSQMTLAASSREVVWSRKESRGRLQRSIIII